MTNIKTYDQVLEETAQIDALKWKFQKEVYAALFSKDSLSRGNATELIVNAIKKDKKIYTIRCDEKREMWIYHEGIYIPQGESYIKEFTRQTLGPAYTPQLGNNVTSKIETDTFIVKENFFNSNNKKKIAVLNGILNLETRELTPYTSDEIFFNKIPITYNPEAKNEAIEQHLKDVLKYDVDLPVMYEIFGYLLWKDYFVEKAIMFSGSGRNGKSKTLDLMKRFIGAENCTNISIQSLEIDKFQVGELFNKMANLSGDIDKIALKHTGVFKSATGRDLLSASRKFMTNLTFINYAKFIFSANELPKTYDITPAFWNRWLLLEFPWTFVSQKEYDALTSVNGFKIADPDIINKICSEQELSGLLNKALDGLQNLLLKGDFSQTTNTEQLKNLWIKKSDSLTAFLNACCEEGDFEVEKGFFKKAYIQYCRLNKVRQVGFREMVNTLDFRGIFEHRDAAGRYWSGIRLRELISSELLNSDEKVGVNKNSSEELLKFC